MSVNRPKSGFLPLVNSLVALSVVGLISFAPPAQSSAHEATDISSEHALDSDPASAALRSILSSAHPVPGISSKESLAALRSFYASRDFEPAWTGSAEATKSAARVRAILADAEEFGLDSSQYSVTGPDSTSPGTDSPIYDLSLTDALLRFASDVQTGRVNPKDIYKDVKLPHVKFDASEVVSTAVKTNSIDSVISSLGPAHPEYRRLIRALRRYRQIAAQGGWPIVTSTQTGDGRSNKALYARLAIEDAGLRPVDEPTAGQLQDAIKRYQVRNGFAPDGVLRPDIVSALNVPVADRIQQIIANLERWRWVSAEFENRYVTINVPDQTLEFVRNGQVVLSSRVIVGRKPTPTPILRTVAQSLVANPPWDIPGDIAARQLLPHLRNNRNYLATHNMVIVNAPGDPRGSNIAWNAVSGKDFPYAIRQMPPYSALGVMMLDGPNKFDVYLHDTPGKRFFRDDDREISNGCVRVEKIMALASLALTNDASAGLPELNSAVSSHQTRRIMLDEPLPIYMLYWTAIADDEGNAGFRPDRYHRDPPLISALNSRAIAGNGKAQ